MSYAALPSPLPLSAASPSTTPYGRCTARPPQPSATVCSLPRALRPMGVALPGPPTPLPLSAASPEHCALWALHCRAPQPLCHCLQPPPSTAPYGRCTARPPNPSATVCSLPRALRPMGVALPGPPTPLPLSAASPEHCALWALHCQAPQPLCHCLQPPPSTAPYGRCTARPPNPSATVCSLPRALRPMGVTLPALPSPLPLSAAPSQHYALRALHCQPCPALCHCLQPPSTALHYRLY